MINVGTFGRLVFQTTGSLLAAENDVSLEGLLIEQIFTVNIHFGALLLGKYVNKFEAGADPKTVATIYKLVNATIKPTKFLKLSIG